MLFRNQPQNITSFAWGLLNCVLKDETILVGRQTLLRVKLIEVRSIRWMGSHGSSCCCSNTSDDGKRQVPNPPRLLEKSEGHYWGACQTCPFFSRLVNSRLCTWPSFLCQDKSVWVVHFNQAESFRDTERAQTPKKSFAAAIRPEFIAAGNTNCQDGGKVWGKRERWWVWSTVISCAAVAWSVALKIAFDQLFFAFCFSSSVWWI